MLRLLKWLFWFIFERGDERKRALLVGMQDEEERVLGTVYKIPPSSSLPDRIAGSLRIRYEGRVSHPQLKSHTLTLPILDVGLYRSEFCVLKTEESRTLLLRIQCYGSDGARNIPITECWYAGTNDSGLPFLRRVQPDAYDVLLRHGETRLFDPNSQYLTDVTSR